MQGVELFFEDCRETMDRLWMDGVFIDLAVTSPPYCVEQDYEADLTFPQYTELLWDAYQGLSHILKPGGYFVINFGDQARGKVLMETETHTTIPMAPTHWDCGTGVGFELQATRIWRKKFARMGIPFVCNHYPRPVFDYEYIWTWRKPDGEGKEVVRDRKLSQRGVLEFEADHPLKRFKAAFPVGLPSWAIEVYSDTGNLVYDPFMGSGTTGLACQKLDRRFIGSEIDEDLRPIVENLLGLRP